MANKTLAAAQKAYKKGKKARANAASKGVVTSAPPKQKKKQKREQAEPVRQSQPKQRSIQKPRVQNTTVQKPIQKATTTNLSKRYGSFKKSSIAPKITNTSKAAKKPTALESARKAYEKGKTRTYLGTEQKKIATKVGKNGKLESVNALTRSEFNRMTEASRYGKKMGNQLLKGGKRTGQKDIREKVGSKTAESAYKSKAATGAMQGMSYADIFSNSVGTYNKQAKKAIKKTKESTAYNVGYGVGMAGDMMLTGVAGRGAALARSAEKAGAKLAAKAGKEVAKEAVEQGAKKSVKHSAKRFAANRAGELAAETPTNILDAAKMSMNENGKVDKKEMAKWAVANTALTAGTGGLIEGIGAAATKKLANNTMDLLGKQRAGTITKEESIKLGKNIKKLANKSENAGGAISGDIAGRNIDNIKETAKENRVMKAQAKAEARITRAEKQVAGKLPEAKRAKALESAEVKRLRTQANELRGHLDTVEKKIKASGTPESSARLSAQKEQIEKALQHTETQIRNAERVAPAASADSIAKAATKERQFEIIKKANPKDESLSDHTWIEDVDDIKTYDEVVTGEDFAPDFTAKQAQEALDSGEITVYSSKPIEDGVFVTPSKMEAQSYAGSGKVYETKMKTNDLAWIDEGQAQVAKASNEPEIKITTKMTDAERAAALSKAVVDSPSPNSAKIASSPEEFENLKSEALGKASDTLQKIGKKFGIFDKSYYNKNINIEFKYSGKSVRKSAIKQAQSTGEFEDLAKAMSCFDEITDRAVPIDVHPDRYVGTHRADANHLNTYVLISSMKDGDSIHPVELIVHERKGKQPNTLYVTVVMSDNKKKTIDATGLNRINGDTATMSSEISVPELIKKINPNDSDFLKYFPDEMLSSEQLKGKAIGIAKEKNTLKARRRETLEQIDDLKNEISQLKANGRSTKNKEATLNRYSKMVEENRADYEADGLLSPNEAPTNKTRIEEIDDELHEIRQKQLNSKDSEEIRELNLQAKALKEEKRQLLKKNLPPKEPKTDAEFDARIAEEERKLSNMKEQNANADDIERQERVIQRLKDRKEGKFSALSDEEVEDMFRGPSSTERVRTSSEEGPKIGGAETAKEVRGEISKTRKLVDSIKRGFFDSFTNLEQIANSIDDVAKRDRFRSLIQNVRMSKGIALSKVADEFIGVYREAGLAKSGAGAKRADFERYCNLKHDLERFDHDTEFLGFDSKEAIQKEIDNLEAKYKDGSLQKFQEGVVKYFDSLLDEDVRSGLDTAENVAKLREDYKNYVPTFRDFDGEMNYPPSDSIHFRNFHEASGGTDHRVLSLYEQAIQKTKTTVKRGAMNDMFQAVAELNGVKVKDLPQGADPIEALQSSTLTFKDGKSHYVQFWENGQAKKLEIPEGVYKGLRQWSGEDKAFFMEWNWLNNRAVQRGNELFKAWITDYSLVFGARNFIRDLETGFFYSPNGMRYARNIPRAVCASLADTKPMQMLLKSNIVSDNFKEYVKTYADLAKAYKNNGGEFAQLVKTTNPEKAIRDVFKKKGVLSAIKEINSTIEMIPRMAEFSAVAEDKAIAELGIKRADWFKMKPSERRAAMNKALADKDNISEAMYRAKEVTLNFDRSGYIGRWLNSGFVPFFNPAVQGLSKLGRVLAKNNKTSSEFASMLAKFAVIGGGSEVLFNATIGALDEYQDISDYHKTGNLCIPLSIFNKEFGTDFKKTDFIKIPKAREVAAMQGPINWGFQHMLYHTAGKDERLFDSLKSNAKMWWEQIGPVSPLSDNLFYAPVRIAKGKNWYGGYINSFDDEDLIKAGKSYKAADEETSLVAYGISKSLNEGADKLGKMLGLDNDQIMGLKQKVWTPKQFDDLMDSYMGIIYDSTIKNTSAKNHDLTDAIDAVNNGNIVGGLHSTWSILKSPFANAFTLDTVFSNRHKQDAYALKTSVNKELSKLVGQDVSGMSKDEIKESVVKQYGYESPEYKSYLKKNAELTRLNQSFLYPSANYGEMMSSIYLRKDLSNAQKDYWVRDIKKQENALLNGRQEGSKYANADPMKYAYNARTKSGKRVFSNEQVVDMCSYESSSGSNNLKDAYEAYKKANPNDKNAKKFFNLTLDAREINRASGDSLTFTSWNVAAYAAEGRKQKSGVDYSAAAKAFGVSDDKLREARKYFTVGKGTIDTYTSSHRQVVKGGIDIGKYVGQMESWDIVNSLSSYTTKGEKGRKLLDRAYYAEGYYPLKTMNASRCLFSDKYKGSHWSTEKISSFCEENGFSYKEKDKDGKTIKPDPEKVAAAISKKWGKNRTAEECAAVFEEICPDIPNPFGEIGDYSMNGDTGIQYDSYGHRRRGHRRRRGGWGGYGGGGGSDSVVGATKMNSAKISDVTFASNLDDVYRRKLKKLRETSRKDLSK